MAATAATNNSINYPILKLVPLSQPQCEAALRTIREGNDSAATSNNDVSNNNETDQWQIPSNAAEKERPTMILKLCHEKDDIVDVDDIGASVEPTKYAKLNANGELSCEVKLGRTAFANISWNRISRALCDIGMTKEKNDNDVTAWIKMRKSAAFHAVFLNGNKVMEAEDEETLVNDGSILSLFGPTALAYRIKIESNGAHINRANGAASRKRGGNELSTHANENAAKRHKHPSVVQDAHALIESTAECSLCLGILVKPVTINPCGHNYCQECADAHLCCVDDNDDTGSKRTDCPYCRGDILGFTQNRSLDSMIWAVALNGCFDRDDAITYLNRREEAELDPPTDEQRECILRCGRGEQEGINSGNQSGSVFIEPLPVTSSTNTTLIPTLPTLTTRQVRQSLNNHSNEVVDLT